MDVNRHVRLSKHYSQTLVQAKEQSFYIEFIVMSSTTNLSCGIQFENQDGLRTRHSLQTANLNEHKLYLNNP